MAGLLRAGRRREARRGAARALRPPGARAHPRHRGRAARDAAGREPRRRGRRRRRERPDGRHHEPAAACRRSSPPRRTPSATPGLSLQAVSDLEPYWEAVRKVYKPFESGLAGPTGRVYRHEIPGGQLSNLRQQAIALGLGDRFEVIEDLYAAASDILGPSAEGDAVVEGRRRPRPRARGGRRRPGGLREEPGQVRHPGFGGRLHGGRARRSAGRLARAVPHQGAQGPRRQDRRRGAHRRGDARRSTGDVGRAARGPQPPAVRRSDPGVRAGARAVRRPVGRSRRPTTCTGCEPASSTR